MASIDLNKRGCYYMLLYIISCGKYMLTANGNKHNGCHSDMNNYTYILTYTNTLHGILKLSLLYSQYLSRIS
jgi:hypothetical protein